jgi:GntR family transcriptional regulator
VRQLAGDLGVNLNTIAVAYRELQEQGLVEVRHGAGAQVIARRAKASDGEELRRLVRSTVAQMAVAGLTVDQIRRLVESELRALKPEGDHRR